MSARAALVVNPSSGGRNARGLELAEMLKDAPAVEVLVLERFEQLQPGLERMRAAGIKALFISSGDGTIQYIQTWLAERSGLARESWPVLALLPHGSTNMTAADIGLKVRSLAAQAELLRAGGLARERARVVARPTVRVANAAGGAQHGMFIGAGVLAEATLFCQHEFNRKGVRGQWGPLLTMLKVGGKALLRPARPEETERVDRPHRMSIMADGAEVARGWQTAMLATTLRKLVLGARPFWGGCAPQAGGEVMRVSVFGHPPPFLPRWLPVAMYGGERRRVHESMKSLCAQRLVVETDSRFVMDGEEIPVPQGEPVVIERGPMMRYLVG